VKCEEEYKSVEHIFHQYLHAAKSDERVCEMAEIRNDRTILTRLHGDNFSRGIAGTRRNGGMDCSSIRQQAPSGHVEDRETRHFIRRLPISPTPSKISHS